ncbi:MAG TPA: UDP-N-acetylmuramoyl-L-alanyl-D-glutamate--2,6-diaminopimelate ligase [Polyangia bacterium]|jgi:UDP-N-acetylmuramoyl-L-alanyl-D-glutamate--2,6-diaminopimelate ligase|nr:UDP-N-acetylmuramoyl-L-alanyl-D-glutamate--2,6-diaminopimelate ligase [Polyangia bacterium]
MKLRDYLRDLSLEGPPAASSGSLDCEVREVCDDSRAVQPGDLFVAVRGATSDGHDHLREAMERGAVAAVVESEAHVEGLSFPGGIVRVASTRAALGQLAAMRYGEPARALRLIGVTGTNGKTTTTFLIESMLQAAGRKVGVLGTVNYRWGDEPQVVRPAPYTTPGPLELHRTLAEMRTAGCTHAIMEVSSHALTQERLAGVRFRVGAFTNLTQDHLDFHGTMDAYFHAKARLMRHLLSSPDGVGVIFMDGGYGKRMAGSVVGERLLVSLVDEGADVSPKRYRCTIDGIEAELSSPLGAIELRSPLVGRYNLANIVVATGVAIALGVDVSAIRKGVAELAGVPGRMERVPSSLGFSVLVDYAHSPDALENVIGTLRPLIKPDGRLLCVFGCGGDRDRAKRPQMGEVVARGADLAIVTSDNPRTEEPRAIVDMILEGMRKADMPLLEEAAALGVALRGFHVEVDRRRAIQAAITAARPDDVVLIAGKGHEDYQIIGHTKHPFDDRAVAREALAERAPA